VLDVLALEATRHSEARRIIERVDNIRAEVKRRLRAGTGAEEPGEGAPNGKDGEDGESTAPVAESR
jgi:hypothetical protein